MTKVFRSYLFHPVQSSYFSPPPYSHHPTGEGRSSTKAKIIIKKHENIIENFHKLP